MRSSALRNFSPESGVRPSTVIGVQAKAWLKGSDVTPPAATAPGECSSRSQSCRYVVKIVCLSLYFRPVIVRSNVSTPRGLNAGETPDEKTRADQQDYREHQFRNNEQPPKIIATTPDRTRSRRATARIFQSRIQIQP